MSSTYLLMLFCDLFLFLLFPFHRFIVLSGLFKGCYEVVKRTKELITLSRSWIFGEESTHSVKLEVKQSFCELLFIYRSIIGFGRRKLWVVILTIYFAILLKSSSVEFKECYLLVKTGSGGLISN